MSSLMGNQETTGATTGAAQQSAAVRSGATGSSGIGGGVDTRDIGTPSQSAMWNDMVSSVAPVQSGAMADWGQELGQMFNKGIGGYAADKLMGGSNNGGASYKGASPSQGSNQFSLGKGRKATQQHTVGQSAPQASLARNYQGSQQGAESFDRGPTAQGTHAGSFADILKFFTMGAVGGA